MNPQAHLTPWSEIFRNYWHPRYWGTWVLIGFLWLVARLPLRWQRSLGRGLGLLAWKVLPKRRHITLVNLALCFPSMQPPTREAMGKACFVNNAIGYLEAGSAWFSDPERFRPLTTGIGVEHFRKAMERGRGVILLGGHYTTLDLGGALLTFYGGSACMQRPHDNPLFNAVMTRSRARFCWPVLGKDDLRGVIRHLKQGGSVWYATDQDYGRRGSVFAEFFGVPAATLTTTARLARMTGAAVVPFSHFRTPEGRYEMYFDPALENYPDSDDLENARRTNAAIENAILRAPDQYMWMHRRFKTEADGDNHRKYR